MARRCAPARPASRVCKPFQPFMLVSPFLCGLFTFYGRATPDARERIPTRHMWGHAGRAGAHLPRLFNRDFLLRRTVSARRLQLPLARGKLPEKAPVSLRQHGHSIHMPLHVVPDRGRQLDHLLCPR